jgi:NAD(P)-dependent dehydrogenase (short-subunit alcohol dehydrogenase family)
VLIGGRDEDRLARALDELAPGVDGRAIDATDASSIRGFLSEAGTIDHLIFTAGGAALGPLVEASMTDLLAFFDGKFWGGVRLVMLALAEDRLSQDGSIVLFSGASARNGSPGFAAGAALNAAVESLVRSLAVELAPIRVNGVSPGLIDTPVWDELTDVTREMVTEGARALPVPRLGRPKEVAQAVALLLENRFMTGTVLLVDGGFVSR